MLKPPEKRQASSERAAAHAASAPVRAPLLLLAVTCGLSLIASCYDFKGMDGAECNTQRLCGAGLLCDPDTTICRDETAVRGEYCSPVQADCGFIIESGVDCGVCPGSTEVCAGNKCIDRCSGIECGMVADAFCGECAGSTEVCAANQCVDVCAGMLCGTVNNKFCGDCTGPTEVCAANQCVDVCAGIECGTLSGKNCGDCARSGEVCQNNRCVAG